jgi:HSP20 family molecular chaperone IbpA
MAEHTIAVPESPQTPSTEGTRTRERYTTPPVDIYETPDGLVVMADLPGVDNERLDVRVDNHVLTIRGQARHGASGEPLYREYELVNYFRQFELSDRVDQARISADLRFGVLTLTLPKAEEAKPRQIPVRVG